MKTVAEIQKTNVAHERYDSLNGVRTYAAIGILCMHVKANGEYLLSTFDRFRLGAFLNNLTFLFMAISAFSLSCGYFERVNKRLISPEQFYKKRFSKIWPFFSILVLLDFITGPSVQTLLETIADLTLLFGLLPNSHLSVMGMGWFLGIIFVFYLCFPFFCFVLDRPKRAWLGMAISLFFSYSCSIYFMDTAHVVDTFYPRTNFMYCIPFFMVGGIIFTYRKKIISFSNKLKLPLMIASISGTIVYIMVPYFQKERILCLSLTTLFALYLCYSIVSKGRILNNCFTRYISGISMEIYLSHMLAYRAVNIITRNYFRTGGYFNYLVICTLTFCLSIAISVLLSKFIAVLGKIVQYDMKR